MRARTVLVLTLLVALAFAGCAEPAAKPSSSSTSAKPTASATSTTSRPTTTATATSAPVNNATLAYAWSPDQPLVGEEVAFFANVSGLGSRSVTSWAWEFGADATASTPMATMTYESAGTRGFLVRARLSDGSELFANDVLTVFETPPPPPPPPFLGLPREEGCTGETATNPRPEAWYSLGKPESYFSDMCFHQFTVNNPDTATMDVMILPPPGALAVRDAALLRASVQMWSDGLRMGAKTAGLDWMHDGFLLTPTVVGLDIPAGPSAAMPDILIVLQDPAPTVVVETYLGIGIDAPLTFCHPVAAMASGTPPTVDMARQLPGFSDHHGQGWGTARVACPNGGRVCVVAGFMLPFAPDVQSGNGYYDLNSHELGHCLGLGHVGDASDFASKAYPADDIMSYEQDPHDPPYALCVSNLNVKTAAAVYQGLIQGATSVQWSLQGGYVAMEGGSDPTLGGTSIPDPLPESSWRVVTPDGSWSPSAADCFQPNTALVQT